MKINGRKIRSKSMKMRRNVRRGLIIRNYIEVDFPCGSGIDDAVKMLLEYRKKNLLAFGSFNGHKLYSGDVSLNNAYKMIVGVSRTQQEKNREELRKRIIREEKEHLESIPELSKEWIEKGKEILDEDKIEYWKEIVPIRLNDLYHGMELGACLDIVKILNNNGTLDEAKEKIEEQGHSGMSFGLVCAMIQEFSKRGKEFVEYVK